MKIEVPDRTTSDQIRHAGLFPRFLLGLNDRSLEWFSASVMTIWGVTLAAPGDTLANPQFAAFGRFGLTEAFWAITFIAFGVARFVALYINGRWPKSPHIRMICAAFGAFSWAQVSILLGLGDQPAWNTGVGLYGCLAVADFLAIMRAGFDARYYAR